MRELTAVIVSLFIIPILAKKKIPLGLAICISAVFMALLGGLKMQGFRYVIIDTFLNFNKLQQFITVIEVSVLGVLLRQYKIIDKVIEYLTKVVRSSRMTLMLIPALTGFLSVPGGAIMSAPFVDRLGEEADLTKSNRAVINLVYRHIATHIMPYTSGFLVVAALAPQIPVFKLAALNLTFVIPYVLTGYFLFMRDVKKENIKPSKDNLLSNLINLLKYTAPVYTSVMLNLLFGVPFYIGMLANLLIVYLLNPNKSFVLHALHAVNFNVIYLLTGVYLIQGIVGQMEPLILLFTVIFGNPKTILLGIIGISLFLGLTTGFQGTPLGVILPILTGLPISHSRLLLYSHMAFAWGFVGYFFSPLHPCQLFTCEYLNVPLQDLYKDYYKFFIALVVILLATYFLLGIWLK